MCHRESMHCGVHGRIADGVPAARTVGAHRRLSTDGQGRGALAGAFQREVTAEPGVHPGCGRPAVRAPSRDGQGAAQTGPVTGDMPCPRRAIPGRPPGFQDHRDIRGRRHARRVSGQLPAARRPPGRLSPNVTDTPTRRCQVRAADSARGCRLASEGADVRIRTGYVGVLDADGLVRLPGRLIASLRCTRACCGMPVCLGSLREGRAVRSGYLRVWA